MTEAWSFWDARVRIWPPTGYPPCQMLDDRANLALARNLPRHVNLVFTTTRRNGGDNFFVVDNPYTSLVLGSITDSTPAEFTKDLLHVLQFSLAMIKGQGALRLRKGVSEVLDFRNGLDLFNNEEEEREAAAKVFLKLFATFISSDLDVAQAEHVQHLLYWWGRMQKLHDLSSFRDKEYSTPEFNAVEETGVFKTSRELAAYFVSRRLMPSLFSEREVFALQRVSYLKIQESKSRELPLNVASTFYERVAGWNNVPTDLDNLYFFSFAYKLLNKIVPGILSGYLSDFTVAKQILDVISKNLSEVSRVSFAMNGRYFVGNTREDRTDSNLYMLRMLLGLATFGVSEFFYGSITPEDFQVASDPETQRQQYLYFVSDLAVLRHLFTRRASPDQPPGTGGGMNSLVDLLSPSESQALVAMMQPIIQNRFEGQYAIAGYEVPPNFEQLQDFAEKLRILLEVVDDEYLIYSDLVSFIPSELINTDVVTESTTAAEFRRLVDSTAILEALSVDVNAALGLLGAVMSIEMVPGVVTGFIFPAMIYSGQQIYNGIRNAGASAGVLQVLGFTGSRINTGISRVAASLGRITNAVRPYTSILNDVLMGVFGMIMCVDLAANLSSQQEQRRQNQAFDALLSSLDAYMKQSELQEYHLLEIRRKIIKSMDQFESKVFNDFRLMIEKGEGETDPLLFYCLMTNEELRQSFIEILASFNVDEDVKMHELSTWKLIVDALGLGVDVEDEEAYRKFMIENYELVVQSISLQDLARRYQNRTKAVVEKSSAKSVREYSEQKRTKYMEETLVYLPSEWPSWSYIEKLAYFSLQK